MRITTSQYARALYELTKDKPENEVDIVIEKFVNNLKKNRLLDKVEEVIKKFTDIYNKENGIVKAKIFVSRKLSETNVEEIAKAIKKKYQAEEVKLAVIVDDKLKGGIKIIVREDILDNSIAGKLAKLRRALV
jgi:F-type H+-transporting ATPase subunit delta